MQHLQVKEPAHRALQGNSVKLCTGRSTVDTILEPPDLESQLQYER